MRNATFVKRFQWKEYEVTLSLYELHAPNIPRRIGYRMFWKKGLVFEGRDFGCSPMVASDSREAAIALMNFLCLREGDVESEYFNSYTPQQKAWRDSYACESLACDLSREGGEK